MSTQQRRWHWSSWVPLLWKRTSESVQQRVDDFKVAKALEDVDFATLDRGWELPGASATDLDPWDRHTLEDSFRSLYFKHDIVKNIIDTYVHFIVGKGFTVAFRSNELQARWDALEKRNKVNERIREAIRMSLLLGNWFQILYPLEAPMKLDVRDLDPSDVSEVITAPNDDEILLQYIRKTKQGTEVPLPAQDVIHWHVNKIGRNQFGRPLLESSLKRLAQFDKLVEDQLKARRIKGMLHMVRYLSKKPDIPLSELPPSSAVIEAHEGHERWEAISNNVDSSEAWRDGLAILQRIASTVHLPVYFLLMDISSTSSSEMHMESIPIKVFKNYQNHFANTGISPMVRSLINEHISESEYEIVPEPVDIRTTSQVTQDTIAKVENAIISRRTAQTELGYDPDKENALINEELGGAAAPDPLGGDRFSSLFGGGGDSPLGTPPVTPSSLTDSIASPPPPSLSPDQNISDSGASSSNLSSSLTSGEGDVASTDTALASLPGHWQSHENGGEDVDAGNIANPVKANTPLELPLIENFDLSDAGNFLAQPPAAFDRKIMAVDDGFSSDAAYLILGLTPDGYIVVLRERYERGVPLMSPDGGPSRVNHIMEIANQERVDEIVVDPSASELISLLEQQQLPVTPADNKVEHGFRLVDDLAAQGKLKLIQGLERLPQEFQTCKCKLSEAGFVKKPHNRSFHGLDALRYGTILLVKT